MSDLSLSLLAYSCTTHLDLCIESFNIFFMWRDCRTMKQIIRGDCRLPFYLLYLNLRKRRTLRTIKEANVIVYNKNDEFLIFKDSQPWLIAYYC